MRRRWIPVIAVIAVPLLGAGGWALVYTRPSADERERAEVHARAESYLRAGATGRCPREVLRGAARPGSGRDELRAILDGAGVHAGCWTLLDAVWEDFRAELAVTGIPAEARELPDDPHGDADAAEDPPLSAEWTSPRTGRPIHVAPLRLERQVLEACSQTVAAIRASLARGDVCSPFGPGWQDAPMITALRAAGALVVAGRDRIRSGDALGGVEHMLDAVRLGLDLGRGPSTVIATVIGGAAIGLVLGHVEIALAHDAGWTPEVLRELSRQVLVLARTAPMPDDVVVEDALGVMVSLLPHTGWAPAVPVGPRSPPPALAPVPWQSERDALWSIIMASLDAHDRVAALSRGEPATHAQWHAQVVAERASTPRSLEEPPWHVAAMGPRALRQWLAREAYGGLLDAAATYLRRLEQSHAGMRALFIVLEHRRLTLGASECPSAAALAEAIGDVPTEEGMGGRFELFESRRPYRPIEVSAPPWLRPPEETRARVRLPVARAYCPAFPLARAPAPPEAPESGPR